MASFRKWHRISRLAFAVAPTAAAVLAVHATHASQGPGGGPGTASPFTQLAMAIIVYGAPALVGGAALALRRR